jgi:putative membrane protein (TIGR04086 family)
MRLSERFDLRALWNGASTAAMIAVPVQVIARLVVDENKRSGWSVLLTLAILFGLVLGSGVAAWHQRRNTPLSHGVVTASGVFIVIQVIFSIVKLIQGDSISWGRIIVSLGLSLVAGICGGMLGSSLLRRGVEPRR